MRSDVTEQKPNGNPQRLFRIPQELLDAMELRAAKKQMTVQEWLLTIAMKRCKLDIELPVRGSKKKGNKQ